MWECPWERVVGHHLVIEEKVDGSQAGICFDEDFDLVVFSRGTRCPRDRNFGPLWLWAEARLDDLFDVLETRYVLYGEWAWLLHTIYYDLLPDYFLEDDVYDTHTGEWLSTEARRRLLEPLRGHARLVSVPVLHEGPVESLEALKALVGRSAFKSDKWPYSMINMARDRGINDVENVLEWVDPSDDMEGLYIKVEKDGQVLGRLKWVRYAFVQKIVEQDTHWSKRRPIPNQLVRS